MNIMALDNQDRLRIAMMAQARLDRAQWELAEMIDCQATNEKKADCGLFAAMWRAGVSREEIAAHFGMSRTTVTNTRDRLGLPNRSQAHNSKETMPIEAFLRADKAGLGE